MRCASRKIGWAFEIAAVVLLGTMTGIARGDMSVEANHVAELTFRSALKYGDPFNQATLDVDVTTPSGATLRVPGFWAGGQTWRARYASAEIGEHHYSTLCSDPHDTGLHQVHGVVTVMKYAGDNPLYAHGFLRVAADKRHFEHIDGTPFFWLGDTWWMGFTNRLHFPDEFAQLTEDRVAKGFTVVQIVAGLYPDMPAFDSRGVNEAGFPWEKDYARISPAYFDQVDRRMAYLVDHGIAPCLVGAWGYHLPWLGVEKMKQHWRYLIARYGAYPGFWCAAGEAAMPYYLAADKAKDGEVQKRGWTEIVRYIHAADPFKHPVSLHPTDLSRTQVTDPGVLDFEMLQTGHGDRASIGPTIDLVRRSRTSKPAMPTINAEVCYEGILNSCHDDVVRIVTWESLLGGTAGHTYGANGIWQMNRKGQPYGKSPHGGTYGPTPWDEAMKLPGSREVGYARKLLEQFEWWKFEPHPEWATTDQHHIAWGDWIWSTRDGDAAHDAPAEKRSFTKSFKLPPDAKVSSAVIHITADDRFEAFLNGKRIGGSDRGPEAWRRPVTFDIAAFIKSGENVLQIDAENVAANVPNNPAGLLCAGAVLLSSGQRILLASDASWSDAKLVAHYGDAPWGRVGADEGSVPPAIAGIPGQVRVIYVPTSTPIHLLKLERNLARKAEYFNPATGERSDAPALTVDSDGSATVAPLDGATDWVLVLRRV